MTLNDLATGIAATVAVMSFAFTLYTFFKTCLMVEELWKEMKKRKGDE